MIKKEFTTELGGTDLLADGRVICLRNDCLTSWSTSSTTRPLLIHDQSTKAKTSTRWKPRRLSESQSAKPTLNLRRKGSAQHQPYNQPISLISFPLKPSSNAKSSIDKARMTNRKGKRSLAVSSCRAPSCSTQHSFERGQARQLLSHHARRNGSEDTAN